MYDMHKELNKFYEDHVRLKDERKKLAGYRNTNLDRLQDGLDKLKLPRFYNHVDQGSFAMFTINQHPENDYDLDEGIFFKKEDLPASALDARKRVEKAMREGGGNLAKPPEALTNAVRVYYTEGHHIDLAIYRTYTDSFGVEIIEHAGCEWTPRDPMDITNWFNSAVQALSPSKDSGSKVDDGQLRRVVRWLKMFAKSRKEWNMPCGLIISVLAVECYVPNQYRDDSSLYDSIQSIRDRLRLNKEVKNPVDSSQTLTGRDKDKTRIKNFEENLECALDELAILFKSNCSRQDASQAWNWVFKHPFWTEEANKTPDDNSMKKDGPTLVKAMPAPWMKK